MTNEEMIYPNKLEKLKKLITPELENFINFEMTPHDILVIQQGSVVLYKGSMGVPLKVLD